MVEVYGNAINNPDGWCVPAVHGGDDHARANEMKARLQLSHPNWEGDFLWGPVPEPP